MVAKCFLFLPDKYSGMGFKKKKKAYRKALAEPRGAGGASPRSAEGASEARGSGGMPPRKIFEI